MQIAAHELGIPLSKIYMPESADDKNPIPNITGGSSACDLSGGAVKNACTEMNKRLAPMKAAAPDAVWEQWVGMAFGSQINLSVHAHFHPDNALTTYDWEKKVGNRWAYYTTGAACSVVEVDVLTGEHTLLKVNIVMDIGESLNPAIDMGQIEGSFIQGYGYLAMEDCTYSKTGELLTPGPATYNMPTVSDLPAEFNVSLLRKGGKAVPKLLYSSKGIGEPPFFNGSSVYFAIKDAVLAARKDAGLTGPFNLTTPTIPENVLKTCVSSPFN
jgi:xanthine dehydrogenase molybdopterin-binding subunit B